MPTLSVDAAVDIVLKIVVVAERKLHGAEFGTSRRGTSRPAWHDPAHISIRNVSDARSDVADPFVVSARTELCRLGDGIHASSGRDGLDEAILRIAEMDPIETDWRTAVLEQTWGEIGRGAP